MIVYLTLSGHTFSINKSCFATSRKLAAVPVQMATTAQQYVILMEVICVERTTEAEIMTSFDLMYLTLRSRHHDLSR